MSAIDRTLCRAVRVVCRLSFRHDGGERRAIPAHPAVVHRFTTACGSASPPKGQGQRTDCPPRARAPAAARQCGGGLGERRENGHERVFLRSRLCLCLCRAAHDARRTTSTLLRMPSAPSSHPRAPCSPGARRRENYTAAVLRRGTRASSLREDKPRAQKTAGRLTKTKCLQKHCRVLGSIELQSEAWRRPLLDKLYQNNGSRCPDAVRMTRSAWASWAC